MRPITNEQTADNIYAIQCLLEIIPIIAKRNNPKGIELIVEKINSILSPMGSVYEDLRLDDLEQEEVKKSGGAK